MYFMINKNIKRFCSDVAKIENYEKAMNDTTQVWHCHHRLETHFSDGAPRPKNAQLFAKELIALNMYYHRPPEELIFLTEKEHLQLHFKGRISPAKGKRWILSKEAKQKISNSHKNKPLSEAHKRKLSLSHKGQIAWNRGLPLSEETKRKMSLSTKGRHRVYDNLEHTKYHYE